MNTDNIDPSNKDATISSADNAETKIAKDELSEELLAKASGGTITKTVDKSSPVLFQNCATGKHFP
jgi:type VI protein secretion system component Hcp